MKGRRGILLACGTVLTAALLALPVSASASTPQDIAITLHRIATIRDGTWTATGAINDAGTFRVNPGHFSAFGGPFGPPPPVLGLHFSNTLKDAGGSTITVEMQLLFSPNGSGLYEVHGNWLVDGATGVFASLHGEGRATGLVNFRAPTRGITLTGKVHFSP